MGQKDLILFLLQIAVMLSVALVCGQAMRRLRLPTVLGELLGGILVGPTIFGSLAPYLYAGLFPQAGMTLVARGVMTKFGLLFFLFIAGTEVNLSYLRRSGPQIMYTSLFGIAVPLALGFGAVLLLPQMWGPQARNSPLGYALLIGTILSISALPVIARILIDLDLIKKRLGIVIMTAATIDDVMGWALFMVILSSNATGDGISNRSVWITLGLAFGLSAMILSVSYLANQTVARRLEIRPTSLICLVTILVLIASLLTEAMGIHAILGAFLIGVALAQPLKRSHKTYESMYQFTLGFFAPLYFVSIGLQSNFASGFELQLVMLVLFVACAGKVVGVSLGARLGKMPWREALAVAFGMNARGAMGIVLATAAFESKLIDQPVFVALVLMALVTSIISGPIMQRLLKINHLDGDLLRESVSDEPICGGLENRVGEKQ